MIRVRWSWLLVVGLAGLAVFVGEALAAVTLGQTGTGVPCGSAGLAAQPAVADGYSYTVRKRKWNIKTWSTRAGADGGQMALVVFRPLNAGGYKVLAASEPQTLTPNVLNTFTFKGVGHEFDVKGGDLIGFWCSADAEGAFSTGSADDGFSFVSSASVPAAGTLMTFPGSPTTGLRANISVTIKETSN
jgi:hypothetical protein